MTKKISEVIKALEGAQEKHGDLPLYMPETDIGRITFEGAVDGVSRTTDGVPEVPNEIIMEIHAAGD